jgi:hypothetical protein
MPAIQITIPAEAYAAAKSLEANLRIALRALTSAAATQEALDAAEKAIARMSAAMPSMRLHVRTLGAAARRAARLEAVEAKETEERNARIKRERGMVTDEDLAITDCVRAG